MQTPSPPNASFQLILDTAEQLIREKGCRQTTLQDIIDRSGLSKGAIYHYVSGKDELFGLILKSKMSAASSGFQGAVAEAADRDAASPIAFIAGQLAPKSADQHVLSTIFIYLLSQAGNPKIAAILSDLHAYSLQTAQQWIQTGQAAGAIPSSIDAGQMAALFMVFVYGLRVQNVTTPNEQHVEADAIFNLLFKSLT